MPAVRSNIPRFSVALVVLALTWPLGSEAQAQDTSLGGEGSEPLQAQIERLEKTVERLDRDRSRIRAPFVVEGPDGRELMVVAVDAGGNARISIGQIGGGQVVIGMFEDGSGISLKDTSGETRVQIAAGTSAPQIALTTASATTIVGTNTEATESGLFVNAGDAAQLVLSAGAEGGGLKTYSAQGTLATELGGVPETAMTLYDSDAVPFLTARPPAADREALTVGTSDGAHAALGVHADGAGAYVTVHGADARLRVMMASEDSDFPIAAYRDDAAIFSVGPLDGGAGPVQMTLGAANGAHVQAGLYDGGGSFVSVLDPGNRERAALNGDADEPPLLVRDETGAVVLAARSEAGGPVQLTVGEPAKAHVQLGPLADGAGAMVSVLDAANVERAALSSDRTEAAVMVRNDSSAPVFEVGPDPASGADRAILGDPAARHATLDLQDGANLTLADDQGVVRAELAARNATGLVALYDPQSVPVFTVGVPDSASTPELMLGRLGQARLQFGTTEGEAGSYARFYDSGDQPRATLQAESARTFLTLDDEGTRIGLGSPQGGTRERHGLVVGTGDRALGTFAFDDKGGFMLLGNPDATNSVALSADPEGGALRLARPGSTRSSAVLAATASGAALNLFDPNNAIRAGLTATETGVLSLYSESGWLDLKSGVASPSLTMMDPGGAVLVEMGVTTDHRGMINLGPAGNGLAGTVGGGMMPASSLVGKK